MMLAVRNIRGNYRFWAFASSLVLGAALAHGQEKTPAETKSTGPVALNPSGTVLLDKAKQRLLLKGEICLREGALEMFACLKGTKEHESIVAVDAKAQIVHAGLLALGVQPGQPVQFQPEFRPAAGPVVEVFLTWEAEGRTHRVSGQSLVRNAVHRFWSASLAELPADLTLPEDRGLRYDAKRHELLWYGPMTNRQRNELKKMSSDEKYRAAIDRFHELTKFKPLTADWVFAGSSFFTDSETGKRYYQAESGDLICVANFATATLDLSTASSQSNEELLFEAYTAKIPPVGTPITLELVPRKPAADGKAPSRPKF